MISPQHQSPISPQHQPQIRRPPSASVDNPPLPAVGDEVTVQVEGAPLKAGKQVVQTAARDTQLTVQRVHGAWLLVSNSWIGNKWIHCNHVALAGAPTEFGDEPVPLATVMRNPSLDPNNPWFLMFLSRGAPALLASGRGTELIRVEDSMMQTLNRMQDSPRGILTKLSVVGILSDAYRVAGDRETAIAYIDRKYTLTKQAQGRLRGVDLAILDHLATTGWATSKYGRLVQGERQLREASEGLDKLLPKDDLRSAYMQMRAALDGRTHRRHADVLIKLGDVEGARQKLRRSLQMDVGFRSFQDLLGNNASGTDGSAEALVAVCEVHRARLDDAFGQMDAAMRQRHRFATWPGHLDDPHREVVVRETPDEYSGEAFHYAISLAVQFPTLASVSVPELSAEWVLNHKLKSEDSLRNRMAAMRRSKPRPASPLKRNMFLTGTPMYSVFSDVGKHATTHGLTSIRGLAADYRLRRFAKEDLLTAREEFEMLRHIGGALVEARLPRQSPIGGVGIGPDGKPISNSPNKKHDETAERTWVDIKTIQERLANGQTLVEFVRYHDFDYGSLVGGKYDWRPDRYAAWIIPAAGDVAHVDLGPAEAVDSAVTRLRQSIRSASGKQGTIAMDGEIAAAKQFVQQSQQLNELLLDPLRERLQGSQELILSPDSELWMVPWAAMDGDEGRFLLEQFRLRLVLTGRDLIEPESQAADGEEEMPAEENAAPGPPLVLADPDFDLSTKRVLELERELLGREPEAQLVAVAKRGKTLLPHVERLPYTHHEARGIEPAIQAYCGVAPEVFVGEQALERLVVQKERPRILVLGTHGFFLPPDHQELAENTLAIQDPSMRCGLLLAGSNNVDDWLMRRGADGVLTGYEVSALDLRGTELAVLSACDTGVGDAKYGEGVAGLRQAFQMAGAESVLATLWQIPDRDTAVIMVKLFHNLARGESKADALRNAQLERIQERRDRFGAAHPLFWAALTLTE